MLPLLNHATQVALDVVTLDLQESYPRMNREEAYYHVRDTMSVLDLDSGDPLTYMAYYLVLTEKPDLHHHPDCPARETTRPRVCAQCKRVVNFQLEVEGTAQNPES